MDISKYRDEDYFLQGTPDVIKYYNKVFEENENGWIVEGLFYKDALGKYEEFITILAEFIRSLGYKNSIDRSFCLSYLIHSGYLSHDMRFSDKAPNRANEITSKLGINIILGDGCCRNYSSLHSDVFRRLGLLSEYFYCYQGSNAFNRAKAHPANHVINLIEHEDNIYGIDMYNLNNLYHFIDPYNLQEISTNRRTVLRYKPYYELGMGESTIEEIKSKLQRFADYSSRRAMNPFDYEANLKYEIKREVRSQESEFRGFHEDTKKLKKEIKEAVDEVNARLNK